MEKRSFCIKNQREDRPGYTSLGTVIALHCILSIMNGVILFT